MWLRVADFTNYGLVLRLLYKLSVCVLNRWRVQCMHFDQANNKTNSKLRREYSWVTWIEAWLIVVSSRSVLLPDICLRVSNPYGSLNACVGVECTHLSVKQRRVVIHIRYFDGKWANTFQRGFTLIRRLNSDRYKFSVVPFAIKYLETRRILVTRSNTSKS